MTDNTGLTSVFDRFRESYTLKFVGSFVLVVLVVAAIGAYISVSSATTLSEDAEARLESSAESKALTLETWADNSKNVARLVSNSEPVRSDDTEQIKPYVDQLVASDELTAGARAIHYIDASTTTILTSTLDSRVGGNPREEGAPWAQQDLTETPDDEVVVTAFNPSVANVTVITFVTPVENSSRAVVYVTTLGGLAEELEASSETGFTVVVDDRGQTVFNSRNTSAVGHQHVPGAGVESPAVQAGLDGESGFLEAEDDAMGYAPIESFDWVVLTSSSA